MIGQSETDSAVKLNRVYYSTRSNDLRLSSKVGSSDTFNCTWKTIPLEITSQFQSIGFTVVCIYELKINSFFGYSLSSRRGNSGQRNYHPHNRRQTKLLLPYQSLSKSEDSDILLCPQIDQYWKLFECKLIKNFLVIDKSSKIQIRTSIQLLRSKD
jgi:hypothetical protein